jgi:copper chaperone NosL
MNLAHKKYFSIFTALLFTLLLFACDGGVSQDIAHTPRQPASEDRCPVCGMKVLGWPGPKGQLFFTSSDKPLFFDNTVDLMRYVLHPDHRARVVSVYVQDMTRADWDQPDVAPWIDARQAWFVTGHNRMGSMGPTLASFADRQVAAAFTEQFAGRVLSYGDIDAALLDDLESTAEAGHDPHHGHAH